MRKLLDYIDYPEREQVDDIQTCRMPVATCEQPRSITQALIAQPTILLSALPKVDKRQGNVKVRDWWLWLVGIVASVVSVGATTYYYLHDEVLLYADARAHIRLARSFMDSLTPGFAQLGQVWLPLHHLLMVPFVWDDFLWRTGLAGSIPSMISYITSALCLFLIIRRLTGRSWLAFIGTLGLILNPNVLYLQSTPLSDVVCVAVFSLCGYFFLAWLQEHQLRDLLLTAIFTFAATLIRYDGWALAVCLTLLVFIAEKRRGGRWVQVFAYEIIFIPLALSGIVLWMLWCKMIIGDPFTFQHGPYSAQAMQIELLKSGILPTYHNIRADFLTYLLDSSAVLGKWLLIAAGLGGTLIVLQYARKREGLFLVVCAIPFIFYVLTLYTGQSVIYITGAEPVGIPAGTFFNVRYGVQVVVFSLVLISLAIHFLLARFPFPVFRFACTLFLVFLIIIQTGITFSTSTVTFAEGLPQIQWATCHPSNVYLARHYDGEKILVDMHATSIDGRELGFDLNNLIYEGSGTYWRAAIAHPEQFVHWVVFNPSDSHDEVAKYIHVNDPVFLSFYELKLQDSSGLLIFHLRSSKMLPAKPVPSYLANEWHHWCGNIPNV
jgi:hypothetical protein